MHTDPTLIRLLAECIAEAETPHTRMGMMLVWDRLQEIGHPAQEWWGHMISWRPAHNLHHRYIAADGAGRYWTPYRVTRGEYWAGAASLTAHLDAAHAINTEAEAHA